jgi:hypothetical protein
MTSTPCAEGIEAIMFRSVGDGPSAWESLLPAEVLRLPEELARVDALLDDPMFFAPLAPFFHPVLGRPGTPAPRTGLSLYALCPGQLPGIARRRSC